MVGRGMLWVMQSDVAWPIVELARSAATESGASETQTTHLLLALTKDPAVQTALTESDISIPAIHAAVGISLPDRARGNGVGRARGHGVGRARGHGVGRARGHGVLPFAAESHDVLTRSEDLAFANEHPVVEPGHLLLAIAGTPTCDAARLLGSLDADLQRLCSTITQHLPSVHIDPEPYRKSATLHPRLTPDAICDLLDQLTQWHNAAQSLRNETRAVRSGKSPRLAEDEKKRIRQHARDNAAWMPLHDHHLYVVAAAAEARTASGHDYVFSYRLAQQALMKACLEYTGPSSATAFTDSVRSQIEAALDRAFPPNATARED